MTISLGRLDSELRAALPEVIGCGICLAPDHAREASSWVERPEAWIRVDWASVPLDQVKVNLAGQVVAAHDGRPTPAEKLAAYYPTPYVLAAILLKTSARSWAAASIVEKQLIDGIIDAAAAKVVTILRAP